MSRFENLGVVVTGGAQGLGEAIARRLISEGASVMIADINTIDGAVLADQLGDRAFFTELDVTDESSWHAAVGAAKTHLGEVGGLVNNAAVFWMGALLDMTPDRARHLLDVNLLGPLLGTQIIAPLMAESGGGSIVNISSIDGLHPMNSVAAYSASKWGVRGLTKASALELGRLGIRVNAVCPSMGNPKLAAPYYDQMDFERLIPHAPTSMLFDGDKKRQVTLGDVAAMVAFLLSDDSATCTGADFVVDGGFTAGDYVPGMPGF